MASVAETGFAGQPFLTEREGEGNARRETGNVIYWLIRLDLKGTDEISFKIYDFTRMKVKHVD